MTTRFGDLHKLPTDKRDFSHHKHSGTLLAGQLPTQDFTLYDELQYSVKWGDTLSSIATRYGYTLAELVLANNISNPNRIKTGQVLKLPARQKIILNQEDLDFCFAFAGAEVQQLLYGVHADPLYIASQVKKLRGEYTQFGASLRDIARELVKAGSIPQIIAPYTHNKRLPTDRDRNFLANWANWPTGLDKTAFKYKDLSYFNVDGPNDFFDNIRSALWLNRFERRAVLIGLEWHGEWTYAPNGIIPPAMPISSGGGHAMAIVGQKRIGGVDYSIFQQTWGDLMGDSGYYYLPRSIVNEIGSLGYGTYTVSRINKSGIVGSAVMDLLRLLGYKLGITK